MYIIDLLYLKTAQVSMMYVYSYDFRIYLKVS